MTGSPGAEGSLAAPRVAVLDGLRGIAILLVLLRHYFRPGSVDQFSTVVRRLLSGGWFGVDLFFVLSGFLITGILYDARHSPVYFRSFYARRFLRIFPLYYGVLLAFGVLLPLAAHALPEISKDLVRFWPWFWSYTVNIGQALDRVVHTGYWEHTWSLAVEEQFYLLWPLVVSRLERRQLMGVALGFLVLASVLRVALIATGRGGQPLYVLTLTRMDGLAAGAWLAMAARGPRGLAPLRNTALVVVAAAAAVMAALFVSPEHFATSTRWMQLVGYPALALGFSGLLAAALTAPPSSLLARTLGSRPLRFFGAYSYAIYLLHFLVIYLLAKAGWARPSGGVAASLLFGCVATTIVAAVAWTSWKLYEGPILKLKDRFPYQGP